MAYEIFYHPSIPKEDLPKIPKDAKETISRAIEERLQAEPFAVGQPLRHSLKGHRKLRVGNYRIIYRVKGKEIIVLKIGHRREIYEKVFPRLNWQHQ